MTPLTLVEWKLATWMAKKPDYHSISMVGEYTHLNGVSSPTRETLRAVHALIAKRPDWFAVNTQFGVYRIHEAGQLALAATPKPVWSRSLPIYLGRIG